MHVIIDGVRYVPQQAAPPGATLGTRLKAARQGLGLTLEAAATQAAVAKSYLWQLERDGCSPSFAVVVRLATVYGVTLDALAEALHCKRT